jgi:hypothetical protein
MKEPLGIPVTIVHGGHSPALGRGRSAHGASSAHDRAACIECVVPLRPRRSEPASVDPTNPRD